MFSHRLDFSRRFQKGTPKMANLAFARKRNSHCTDHIIYNISKKQKITCYIAYPVRKFQQLKNTHRLREPLRREVCFLLTVAHTNKSENKNKHRSFFESPPFCKKQ